MNAYHEIFYVARVHASVPVEYEDMTGRKLRSSRKMSEEEIQAKMAELRVEYPTEEILYDKEKNCIWISPGIDRVMANNNIAWALVECEGVRLMLPSGYSEEQLRSFLEGLLKINYYDGFGRQFLYGVIAHTDGTWMDRGEYEGQEWWNYQKYPQEPDWEMMRRENEQFDDECECSPDEDYFEKPES